MDHIIKSKLFLVWTFTVFLFASSSFAQKAKVACIGNSVTFGFGINERTLNSYPAQLQNLLGEDYIVSNFGHSGATVLKNGHKPYWNKDEFKASKDFLPNIVIIHLGLNDQGMNNWPNHKDEFINDYLDLISTYRALPSKPRVLICRMSPTFSGHHWFEEGMRESFKEIQKQIELIAQKAKVDIIDLHEPLYRFPEYFPDNIHPTREGAAIIAEKVYAAITGNYGGLKLPFIFSDNMVIQRYEPIIISGTSNAHDEIQVTFNGEDVHTTVGNNGQWKVSLPSFPAGGPYKLLVKSKASGNITIDKVFIGEVWLASGQSNMAFETKNIINADAILKDSINPNIHLFDLEANAWPDGRMWGKEDLEKCNAEAYFKKTGWEKTDSENLKSFSAIAYAFAYTIQKELNIPIGIIHNSVGGSTTQSWISRETLEATHETVDLLNDTHLNPMVQPWVSERKALNLANMDALGIKARHPFDPTMLFDAGINPIKNFNIKGAIWYQGESNAERVALHSRLFRLLVQDWRMQWNKAEMPFYYVQLSSLNRATWGQFRDSQRQLLSIPNTGMAVSSDLGHPSDVHPKEKWEVGWRLAKIALAKSYNFKIPHSGPLFDFVNIHENRMEVHFTHAEGLTTSDGKVVADIQIAGADKIFVEAEARIRGNLLEVWSDQVKKPRFIKYAYTPFTNGNLINKHKLPASTFSNMFVISN